MSGKRYVGKCPACGYVDSLTVHEKAGRSFVFCYACQDVDAVFSSMQQRGITTATSAAFGSAGKLEGVIRRSGIHARELWLQSRATAGTLVETYLRSRGIILPVPASLRFLPNAHHSPTGLTFPTMIAAISVWTESRPCAVHRTFLDAEGRRKANVLPPRMSLGRHHGGAVRLAEATDNLLVGEGIETCLAAMQATGRPAWAGLSTSGLRNLKLPRTVKDVTVLADGDDPGEAADASGQRVVFNQRLLTRRVIDRITNIARHIPIIGDSLKNSKRQLPFLG
jgi:hypothetical protein